MKFQFEITFNLKFQLGSLKIIRVWGFVLRVSIPVFEPSAVAHHPLYQTHAGLEPAIC